MPTSQKTYEVLLAEIQKLEQENQTLKQTQINQNYHQTKINNLLQFTQYSIDTISDSILWLDEKGKYIFVNNAACINFGYSKEEFLSMTMFQVDPLFTKEIWDAHWQEILERKSFTLETINKRKDGTTFPIEVTVNLVEYDGKKYNCAIVRDITEQKLNESKLKQAALRLSELNATKDKFFSIIAHDLKGPLGSHREFTKSLSEKITILSDEDKFLNLQILNESSEKLYSLMENLLHWASTQNGMITFQPVLISLYELIHKTIDLLSLSIHKKNLTIQNLIPKSFQLNADSFMIETIFRNLISNAIKYSNHNQTIEIGCNFSQTKNDTNSKSHCFYVKDEGIGMSKDQINSLFRLDQKVSTPGTAQEVGTGLGLILSKDFIEQHGGKIWVESVSKEGTTFYFELGQHTI
ncbi:PAS domain-containing sensor histidine kinase [Leptospira levettii]|uniref:PAS domain-containing sensor histidine kinase n=1 Tax=Leptospira levettii TaxID=2023178 RepID=UPI000C2AB027|nr:HAMP domain-containing sensor histidine kinase [Leptospira levettii]MCW7474393.1 ATP-binding protein [Leptospira levettii]PJZ38699.1 PAS domain-containing sensor histidine kinase [Leptospira levettii]PJZ90474.1 PAS domain-containing sensor histidine kinase [Leptospira levettii]PKA02032.1 PAS domain-containing sensor histidine kinase [Leptospira levettii]